MLESWKIPLRVSKIGSQSFRFHRVEGVYTEKMITLSNVREGSGLCGLGLGLRLAMVVVFSLYSAVAQR